MRLRALVRARSAPPRTPARRRVPEEVLRKVRQVEIKARILADEGFLGTFRSVFRGSGLEFEEVREYEPGDEIRTIDWNVTARMGAPYVKKFREERELNLILAVDLSASSWFGTAHQSKRELAADVAALLAVTALRTNDKVALLLFSDRVQKYVPPRRERDHVLRVIEELLFAESRRARTDLEGPARYLANVAKKRSLVFVLSDFLDTPFEGPLRLLGRKHDVIGLTLNDPREEELPPVGLIGLEDAETGRVEYVDTADARLRASFAESARQRRGERVRSFSRIGLDTADLWTDRPYVPALMALFASRARRA